MVYDRANIPAIRKSAEMFRWQETFEEVPHPDEQVKVLNEVITSWPDPGDSKI